MDYTENGVCPEKCGRCCTNILPLSDYEIKKIKQYVKHHEIVVNNPKRDNNVFDDYYKDVCPFLDENKRCQIYIQIPEVYRRFMCNGSEGEFCHEDKKIISLIHTFFPHERCIGIPDIGVLDKQYQDKKAHVKELLTKNRDKDKG